MSLAQIVAALRSRRGMWLVRDDYESVVSFLMGYQEGSSGLTGFQELIELKYGRTSNVHWSTLAVSLRWAESEAGGPSEEAKIAWLLDLIDEFLTIDAGETLKTRRLFYEWVMMAQTESSHDADLLRYSRSPAPEIVSLNVVAGRLGVDQATVLALVRERALSASRHGADVLITAESLNSYLANRDLKD